MRVCYFGTFRQNYSRNRLMIDGLRLNGVEVVECHVPLWTGIEDRVDKAVGGWRNPRFVWRVLRAYVQLLRAYRRVGGYDVLMLGYPGYFDTFVARPLARLAGKPLVLDTFMSIYLIAEERGLMARSPFTGRLIRMAERFACRLPDMLILDTAEYVDYFHHLHGLSDDRFRLVPTGADDRIYQPIDVKLPQDGRFRVVYYGTFIPNHGTLAMVKAAHLLTHRPDIQFELIGRGPDRAASVALAEEHKLSNITFTDWVDKNDLPGRIARADLCLGVFGITPQSMMTVQNKIYEGLAMGKPVISGDSPTVRAALTHGEHIWLCERDNPESLSEAILLLASDQALCQRLAVQGYSLFQEKYSIKAIGRRLLNHLEELHPPAPSHHPS